MKNFVRQRVAAAYFNGKNKYIESDDDYPKIEGIEHNVLNSFSVVFLSDVFVENPCISYRHAMCVFLRYLSTYLLGKVHNMSILDYKFIFLHCLQYYYRKTLSHIDDFRR